MKFRIEFEGEGGGDSWFKLEDGEAGATKTSWGMSFDVPYPFNLMSALFGGGMMNKMFDQGLADIKTLAEQKATEAPTATGSYEVKPMEFPGRTYLGIREKTTQAEVMKPSFWEERFGKIAALMEKSKMQPTGSPAGVYFIWDEAAKTTDMAVTMPVNKGTAVAGGTLQTFDLPASKALVVDYVGPYSSIGGAHQAVGIVRALERSRVV